MSQREKKFFDANECSTTHFVAYKIKKMSYKCCCDQYTIYKKKANNSVRRTQQKYNLVIAELLLATPLAIGPSINTINTD